MKTSLPALTLALILLCCSLSPAFGVESKWATGKVIAWDGNQLQIKVSPMVMLLFLVDPASEIHSKPRVGALIDVHYYLYPKDNKYHITEVRSHR